MLYIDEIPITVGRAKHWRVYADHRGELRRAIDAAGAALTIKAQDTAGEHTIVTTVLKNRLCSEGATVVRQRELVKLIKRKRTNPTFGRTPYHGGTPPEGQEEPAKGYLGRVCSDAADLEDVAHPKTGGVTFHTKVQSYNDDDSDIDEI